MTPKTFKIKSFGCQMNVYDGERMAELLGSQGMAVAADGEDADLVVLNTCHIREKAAEIGWWQEPGKDNILRLLGRRGTLPVTVNVLSPLDRAADRKQLAHQAREEIARMLGFKSVPHSPIDEAE